MATTLEELQIKFTAEMGGLSTQLNGVKQAVAGIEAPTGKASGALGNLAKMGKIIGGAAIGAKLISVGKEAIAMANDAVESEQLFEVSMGGMADSSRKWSEELSKSLGLNAVEVRKSVGTFNVMFNSMGFGETQARDMSQSMTELAQDMASFYNLDPTEAFQKLSAGITGEAEPLKRLGILIDENTISQYAMKNGISTTGKEMTQQQKVLARYGAIMQQTKKAQGDLARTMESPTNQLRRMSAQVDAAKIALGTALQPALLAVLPALTSLAVGATDVINALTGMGKDGAVATAFDDISVTLEQATQDIADVVDMGFVKTVDKINDLKEKTDSALNDYVTAGKKTKKVAIEISLDPPTTTGAERITTAIQNLGTQFDTVDVTPITKQLAVIMEDGTVTPKEGSDMSTKVNKWSEDTIKAITVDATKKTKEIDALIKAGTITEAEGSDLKGAVEAKAEETIKAVTATVGVVNAEISAGPESMTTVSFSAAQASELSGLITDEITSSTIAVDAIIDEVNATFNNTGTIGLAVEALYTGLQTRVAELNGELSDILAGWTDSLTPPTADDWKKVLDIRAERERLLGILSGGLTTSGQLTGALANLTLDTSSISAYFTAYTNAFTAESNAAAQQLEAQKIILQNAFGQPEFEGILEAFGLAGMTYEQAISALQQQIADALTAGKSAAVIDAAEKLLPSVAAAIASGDQQAIADASAAVATFVAGIDVTTLNDKGKEAALALLNGLDLTYLNSQVAAGIQDMKAEILLSMAGVSATFGEKGKESMLSLLTALEQGRLTQSDFDSIIGASSSKTALAALAAQMYAGGDKATGDLVMGLLQQQYGVAEAARLLAEASKPKPANTTGLGADIGQGLINGMDSKIAAIKRKARELANAATNTMYVTAETRSPSKVTTRLGAYIGEGLAIGMTDTTRMVSDAASALAMGATNALTGITATTPSLPTPNLSGSESAISRAVEQVMGRLNIELVVDGERLGRASIKAINSVQQRSGRTILSVT